MKAILSWSSGKDCAWALHVLRQTPGIEVVGLLSTINTAFDRVAMHGVRRNLVEAQATAAGLPLTSLGLPWPCSNETYRDLMGSCVSEMRSRGVEAVAFGDIFLEDVRAYREQQMMGSGLTPLFPLWGQDTRSLAKRMIDGGLEARIACLDPRVMPRELAGARFDAALLEALPTGLDPCGENGEFHTFAHAGPMFSAPIEIRPGETVERDGFVFTDLLAA
ncbi:MAG: ATP-binding protein [Hyphomicrobium sp.]